MANPTSDDNSVIPVDLGYFPSGFDKWPDGVWTCPAAAFGELDAAIRSVAELWHKSPHRPSISPEVLRQWDELSAEWAGNSKLPLFVRKHRGDRGQVLTHDSGRAVIPVDNSPAHWSFGLALQGICPSIDEIVRLLELDAIPIAFSMTKSEKAAAKFTGKNAKWLGYLGRLGWKVCHVREVGLSQKYSKVTTVPIGLLQSHFMGLIYPGNMLLMPLKWGGLGELPEVRERFSEP